MHGLREKLPPNYGLVRDIVCDAGRGVHRTANDIYRIARERRPSIGFATVHRALGRLVARGEILKIEIASAPAAWYEAPASPHAHLQCTTCAALIDVDYRFSSRGRERLAQKHRIAIESASVTFRGRCSACASQAQGTRTLEA